MSLAQIGGVATAAPSTPAAAANPGTPSFGAVLEARGARLAPPAADPATGPFHAVALRGLESVERAQTRIDGLLAAARSGQTFTPQELLGLQAAAYRYSQAVELGAKLVEQGAQAVRQALNAQVFLYDSVLRQPLGEMAGLKRVQRRHRVPVVLAR